MRYYVVVKIRFKHTREECESKRVYVFRCLQFSLSGPCELLFLLCFFIVSWTSEVVSVMFYPCMFVVVWGLPLWLVLCGLIS